MLLLNYEIRQLLRKIFTSFQIEISPKLFSLCLKLGSLNNLTIFMQRIFISSKV